MYIKIIFTETESRKIWILFIKFKNDKGLVNETSNTCKRRKWINQKLEHYWIPGLSTWKIFCEKENGIKYTVLYNYRLGV